MRHYLFALVDKALAYAMLFFFRFLKTIGEIGEERIEKYILQMYGMKKQFDKVLTTEQENYLAMSISSKMTWKEVQEEVKKKSAIILSKRQCYKLKGLAGSLYSR